MKRREFTEARRSAAALVRNDRSACRGHARSAQDKKLKIGFSQATTIEPWRAQFNKDIIAEAAKHPEVELIITDGEDKTEKQVADVENLIRQEVDALLVSPKESAGLTGVVAAGDRRQDSGVRARPQCRHRPVHAVRRRRQQADRPRGRRIRRRAARRQGQGSRQRRRDLGRHGHAAGA